jgi:D-3-phosphoglycerate dehydrogenase
VKLHTSGGERWVEGAVFEPGTPRLVLLDGVAVEAPLEGALIVLANDDRPGVIGEVGTILGRHGINIGTFALGRGPAGAVGVVSVDAPGGEIDDRVVDEVRRASAVKSAVVVRI